MQQAIDYINKKIEKYSKVVSDMDKKYIWNEIKYTYHGWFDHGYAKWKLTALEDMKDEVQALWDSQVTDKDCIAFIKKSIEENPAQVLQWLLLNIWHTMWEMNADNITTEADMNDPRGWRMRVEMKIEKIIP